MENINYHNATKILKGKDALEQLCNECLSLGDKVLIVFSENDIKQTGLYARVVSLLNIDGIAHVTYECESDNYTEKELSEVVGLGKQENVQLILSIGDEGLANFTKVIAHEVWVKSINGPRKRQVARKYLPIINVSAMLKAERGADTSQTLAYHYAFIQPAALFLDYEF